MSIQFKCPKCGKALKAAAEHAGKTIRCPGCEQALRLPEPKRAVRERNAAPPARPERTGPERAEGPAQPEAEDQDEPICFGRLVRLLAGDVSGIFMSSTKKLIAQGNIKELVRISAAPPNKKAFTEVVGALARLDVGQAVDELVASVRTTYEKLDLQAEGAANLLAQIQAAGAVHRNVRLALTLMGEPAAQHLRRHLRDNDPKIRELAVWAVGEMGLNNREILADVCRLLSDNADKGSVRKHAAASLRSTRKKVNDPELGDWINARLSAAGGDPPDSMTGNRA